MRNVNGNINVCTEVKKRVWAKGVLMMASTFYQGDIEDVTTLTRRQRHFALTSASPKLLLRQLLDVRLSDVRFESWFRKGGLFSKTAKLRSVTWIVAVVISVRGEQDGRSAGELCVKR